MSLAKRLASLKFKAVWKGSYEDSWHHLDNFENAKDLVCKYLTSCTPAIRKVIYKLIGPLGVSALGDSHLIKEAKRFRKEADTL